MRQNQILLMADADFIERIGLGNIRHQFHLLRTCIARDPADGFQRNRDNGIIRVLVWRNIALGPCRKICIGFLRDRQNFPSFGTLRQIRHPEITFNRINIALRQFQITVTDLFPLSINLLHQRLNTGFMNEDFDACLIFVIAASIEIIDADDSRHIGQHILKRQEIADFLGNHRRAPLPTTDIDGETEFACFVLLQLQANVVHLNGRTIMLRTDNRNLELAWEIGKLRMQRRPLA